MREKLMTLIKFQVCLILMLAAYIPTIMWMYWRWNAAESYYSHGILIPFVSLFIVWQRRDMLVNIPIQTDFRGLLLVVFGMVLHIIAAVLRIYFLSGFTLIMVLFGLILYFFGSKMIKALIFPIFFLIAMIPMPLVLIGNLTVQLKLLVTQASVFVLNHIGFPSIQDGSVIRMPNSYIEVAAPCSGLRSLISLLTLGLLFAYALKIAFWKKVVLFLSSIPIAMFSNLCRVLMIAVVNDLYGEKVAMGFFHDFSGYMIFVIAFICLYVVSKILDTSKQSDF